LLPWQRRLVERMLAGERLLIAMPRQHGRRLMLSEIEEALKAEPEPPTEH
jgi:hypothetical protein